MELTSHILLSCHHKTMLTGEKHHWSRLILSNYQNGPDPEIMVFIVLASSEVSDESAHPRSLVRAFSTRTNIGWK